MIRILLGFCLLFSTVYSSLQLYKSLATNLRFFDGTVQSHHNHFSFLIFESISNKLLKSFFQKNQYNHFQFSLLNLYHSFILNHIILFLLKFHVRLE